MEYFKNFVIVHKIVNTCQVLINMTKKISIIIPTYNSEKWLKDCIASIENQDIKHDQFEIIIVNDGSTDKSKDIAIALQNQYNNIKVITQKNQGVSVSRNTGIKEAKGEFILFVDPDDTIIPNCLMEMYQFVKENKLDIGMFGMRVVKFDGTESYYAEKDIERKGVIPGITMYPLRFNDSSCKYLFKREIIIENRIFFNEKALFVEDGEFVLKIMSIGKRVSYKHIVFYNYFMRHNSATNSKMSLSRKAILGSLNSAKSIECFQLNNNLSKEQYIFLNQGIVKFTIMPLLISSSLKYLSTLPKIIKIIKKNAIYPLPLEGLEGFRLKHAKLYNKSIFNLVLFFIYTNTKSSFKIKLASLFN